MDGYGPASYGDGIADTYDDWYGAELDTGAAVEALLALAARAGARRALELGIGSGRLALPLAEHGLDVWGVDASEAMVAALRAKRGGSDLRVAIGDMADADLCALPDGDSARFGLIFVAVNTFFNLTTVEAQMRCAERVRALLEPDGLFVLEAFVPAADAPTNAVEARTVELDHVILTASRHDPVTQTVTGQHIELRETGVRLRPWMIRYAPPDELDRMLGEAGLRLVERWSDWKGTRFAEGDNRHVSLYAPQ